MRPVLSHGLSPRKPGSVSRFSGPPPVHPEGCTPLVSERRVATLGIIDVFDEARQRGSDVVESLVLRQVDLLDLECLHEALSLGVVVGVAAPTHRPLEAVLGKLGTVIFGSVLRTAIGVVDTPWWRSARCDGGS